MFDIQGPISKAMTKVTKACAIGYNVSAEQLREIEKEKTNEYKELIKEIAGEFKEYVANSEQFKKEAFSYIDKKFYAYNEKNNLIRRDYSGIIVRAAYQKALNDVNSYHNPVEKAIAKTPKAPAVANK